MSKVGDAMTQEDINEIVNATELGNAIAISGSLAFDSPVVKDILNKDMRRTEKLLDYLKVVKYIEPFQPVEGPLMDRLGRTKLVGWHGVIAAPGYDAFKEHFKCRQEHTPMYPSLKFVWKMFKRYWTVTRNREDGF